MENLQVSAKCGKCGHSGYLVFWLSTQQWVCQNCWEPVRPATGYEPGYDPNHPANQKAPAAS